MLELLNRAHEAASAIFWAVAIAAPIAAPIAFHLAHAVVHVVSVALLGYPLW